MFSKRKGIMAFNMTVWALRFIFMVVVLGVCVVLISIFLNNKFDTVDVQAEVLVQGFLYGTGGISYFDPLTARIYPEIVDVGQLNGSELDMGFYYPNNNLITAKIDLEKQDRTVVKTVYYNKEWYENWKPLLPLKHLPGIGGVTDYSKELPVIIRDEYGNLKAGYVVFQVVQPKAAKAKK